MHLSVYPHIVDRLASRRWISWPFWPGTAASLDQKAGDVNDFIKTRAFLHLSFVFICRTLPIEDIAYSEIKPDDCCPLWGWQDQT